MFKLLNPRERRTGLPHFQCFSASFAVGRVPLIEKFFVHRFNSATVGFANQNAIRVLAAVDEILSISSHSKQHHDEKSQLHLRSQHFGHSRVNLLLEDDAA